jgi:hypothetical protein
MAFRSDEVFKIIPHTEKGLSAQYYKFTGRERFKVATTTKRAAGTRAIQIGDSMTSDSYLIEDQTTEIPLPVEFEWINQAPITLQKRYVELTTEKVLLGREATVAGKLTDATVITQGVNLAATPTKQFNAYGTSSPQIIAQQARNTVQKATGRSPNLLIMSFPVYAWLQFNPALQEVIKYTAPAILYANNAQQALNGVQNLDANALRAVEFSLAQFFNVDKVIVASAIQDTQNEGQDASPVTSYIWGYDMVFCYVSPSPTPDKAEPSAGYTFARGGMTSDSWFDQANKTTYIRSGQYYVSKLVMASACYLVKNAVDSGAGIS